MCGRTALFLNPEELQNITGAKQFNNIESYRPSYNNPPMRLMPVLLEKDHILQLDIYRWGVLKQYSTFNARDDKLESSKLYKGMLKKRCCVPINGFYEWTKREPNYFTSKDDSKIIYLAGLCHKMKEGEQEIFTFTIITTSANSQIRKFHHRMPLIISEQDVHRWLNGKWEDVKDLVHPSENELKIYAVRKEVGSIKNDGPELITKKAAPNSNQKTMDSFFQPVDKAPK
eukprot:NODE_104_length_19952_cov_0.449000.p11 type:complete len:229 gc:universal NODE_104_length_19952_cov_0.449000:13000-12314(-)